MDDRKEFGYIVTEKLRAQHSLARMHPVAVAAYSIDLTVVNDIAVGVSSLPTGKGIGAEARVNQRDRRLEALVGQIGEVGLHLIRNQHALVDDCPRRKAGRIKIIAPLYCTAMANLILSALADDVEFALEGQFVVRTQRTTTDKNLALPGFAQSGRVTQSAVVGGHIPPADQLLSFFIDDAREDFLAGPARIGVRWQEKHPHPVLTRARQIEVANTGKERVGHL